MHGFLRRNDSTTETLKMEKNFPGFQHKFPGKREISRPDFPGNTTFVNPR